MADLDRPCNHDDVHLDLRFVLMEDSGCRQLEISGYCTGCGESMLWGPNTPVGLDLAGTARSVDRRELRVAWSTALDRPDPQGATGFTIGPA